MKRVISLWWVAPVLAGAYFDRRVLVVLAMLIFILALAEIYFRKPHNFWSLLLGVQMLGLFSILDMNLRETYFLLAVVILNDTFAFVGGKYFNFFLVMRKKIFPVTSPKKTWGGAFYGIIFSLAGASIYDYFLPVFPKIFVYGILLSLFSILGDYFESKFKRSFALKDSGEGLFTRNLLKGHGGILDRFDAISLAGWGIIWLKIYF